MRPYLQSPMGVWSMKKIIFLQKLFLLLLFSCASIPSARQPSVVPLEDFQNDKMAERITAVVTPQIGIKNVGAIVAIYNKGKLSFLPFGETVRGNKTLPTADTIFEIGSVTKTFTGLMLARSIDLDRVTPTDTLDQFKEEWRGQKVGSINLTELITHRSGLPRLPCNLHPSDRNQPYQEYTENDLIEGLKDSVFNSNCELQPHPTSTINYSNWALAVLGYVLASKQRTSYEALLHELVLDPLKLTDTALTFTPDQEKRFATGYNTSFVKSQWKNQILQGQGAVKSSARDIMKYAQIYLHPKQSFFENSVRRVTQVSFETKDTAIGYAWFVKKNGSIWHNGQTGGFYTLIKIYPKRDLVVFYLTNTARELKCFMQAVEEVPCDPTFE